MSGERMCGERMSGWGGRAEARPPHPPCVAAPVC